MATKEQIKQKKKLIKQKQIENRYRNKNNQKLEPKKEIIFQDDNTENNSSDNRNFIFDASVADQKQTDNIIITMNELAGRKITDIKSKYGQFHDKNGILTYDGEIKDDIMHGQGKMYYPNGNVEYEGQFYYGYLKGKGIYYYKNGNKRWEGEFKEVLVFGSDLIDIYRTSYSYADKFGRIINGKSYREDGTLEYEGQFKLGVPNGNGKLYDSNENLTFIGRFNNGKTSGKNEKSDISDEIREIIGTYCEIDNLIDLNKNGDKSPYDILQGAKYFILGDLFQLKMQFVKKKSNKDLIEFIIDDIKGFTNFKSLKDKDKVQETYKNAIDEVDEAKKIQGSKTKNKLENLIINIKTEHIVKHEISEIDMIALKCCNSIIKKIEKSYLHVIKLNNPLFNYYLILTLINVSMDLLERSKSNINSVMYEPLINIYVDDDGKLVEFTVADGSPKNISDLTTPVINICHYIPDEQENYLKKIYEKLTVNGRIFFSTGEIMYENINVYKRLTFDYWPSISSYIKCIECEMKARIGNLLIANIPKMKTPLTLGSYYYVFKNYKNKLNEILNTEINDEIIAKFYYLLKLRNKDTHEGLLTYDEYNKVRDMLIKDKLLETIIQIEPLDKKFANNENFDVNDVEMLNSTRLEGNLREIIDYKNINDPLFEDNEIGISLLNRCSNILFNNPFTIDNKGILETYISSEVSSVIFGCLNIKDSSKKKELYQMQYNYSRMQLREYGVDILYSAYIQEKQLNLAGTIKIIDNQNYIDVAGDGNILEIKKNLYKNLLIDKSSNETEKIYEQYHNKILVQLLSSIENNLDYKEIILKIIGSEDVWMSTENTIIMNSYKLIKELLKSLYKNYDGNDKLTNKIIAEACCYCVKNRHSICSSDDLYLYPYAVIKVKDEDVIEVNLERIKSNGDKTIFEIVYN